jgi:hypothetical protein
MKTYDVFTKKEYVNSEGKQEAAWYKAGYIKATPSGGKFLQLFSQPDTTFYIFAKGDSETDDIQTIE